MSDRDGPRATASFSRNWLIVFAVLLLIGVVGFLVQLAAGPGVASMVTGTIVIIVALLALVDGFWRLIGYMGFLGPGEGVDRVLALIQVVLALGVLFRAFT